MDLQPEMRNLLMRNGLQAHVAFDGGGYRLIVQGHDSPLLVYPITERQMLALTDWGTNTANKKAYNILTSIIGKDFYMPKNFVHARNANGRVAMGLHGYRIGIGEYGHMGRLGMPPPFLGWTPREQWGFHLRRVGGQLFFPGPSIVPERPDGRMKPGELQSVDMERRTLTVQSESVNVDMVYDLTEEEVKKLATASIEEQPVEKRLDLLNGIIGADFADKVTMEQLNSEQRISIGLHPEVRHELEERQRQEQELFMQQETPMRQEYIQGSIGAAVDGRDLQLLNESKGWYREEKHGREVEVSDIAVQPAQTEGKYKMSAVIDGQVISHEISQKDYDKFLAVDDYHRMKLFSKIFNEVDMKTRPEANKGLGVKIFAALTAGAVVASEVAHGFHHHHSPEFYGERFSGPPHPYFKPGVDTPRDVAIRNFEAQMNQDINEMRRGR